MPKSVPDSEKKVFWSQHLASITLSLVMLLVGLANGFSSPYLARLVSQDCVDGIAKVNHTEVTWLASCTNIGRILGAVLGGVAQDTVGRKWSLNFSGIPMLVSWIYVAMADSIGMLYISRILCGLSMGMVWTTMSLYLAEIADPEIRGSLVLWNVTIQSIGVFVGNLMGPHISMHMFGYISLVPNLIFLGLFAMMPDSPYQLIMAGKLEKAEESLKWFRRRKDVKQEFEDLQDFVTISRSSFLERLKELKEPKYRRSFLMMFLINIFNYFGASNVINNYMEIIATDSKINSKIVAPSTIVTAAGFFSCIVGLLTTFLVDRFGRRFFLIGSSLGMALSLSFLGAHFRLLNFSYYDPTVFTFVPCACLLTYMISYNAGCASVPCALVGELFSPKLKTIVSLSFCGIGAIFSTLSTVTYRSIHDLIGADWIFWSYASGIFVSVVYYYYRLPETMGKTLKDLQKD